MNQRPGHSRYLRRGYVAPDELVNDEIHGSRWFYFPGPVAALVIFGVFDYAAGSAAYPRLIGIPYLTPLLTRFNIPGIGTNVSPQLILLGVGGLLTLLAVLWFIVRLVEWAGDVYAVTSTRLVEQDGIVTHVIREIPLSQVRDVDVHQKSLVARVFRYGTLSINSLQTSRSGAQAIPEKPIMNPRDPRAAAAGVELWIGIPNPVKIQQEIEVATEKLQRTGSVSNPVTRL